MNAYVFFLIMVFTAAAEAQEVLIPQGVYKPLLREPGEVDVTVGPFSMDLTPVTNQQFLTFVKKYPQFSKTSIKELFADSGYIGRWVGKTYPEKEGAFPVVQVSWFVARRFCEAQGKRLPTIAEWEYASDSQSPASEKQVLEWYGKPGTKLRPVGKSRTNKFGVKDSHGLIWEWVDNFSETIMAGDSRNSSGNDSLFCGGASLKAKDPRSYAAFMRFAFRSSLNARYTSANLGFRCVRDTKGSDQ